MKRNWFWLTFLFWVLCTVSVVSWALIFSPARYAPQIIGRFQTRINGERQDTEIWRNEGRLKDLLPVITEAFQSQGWRPTRDGIDLAPALLGAAAEDSDLPSRLQVVVFQKKGSYKTLGLWEPRREGETYGWTSEIPDAAFNPQRARANWDFPLLPPADAQRFYCQSLRNFEVALVSRPGRKGVPGDFGRLCASQGFQARLWRKDDGRETYSLSKGKDRLLAVVARDGAQEWWTLVRFGR